MSSTESPPEPKPDRTDPIPDSYAIHVTAERLVVWQYQHSISAPEGGWELVETFDQGDNPQFSLTQATLTGPNEDGYWMYAKEYDCFLGCN